MANSLENILKKLQAQKNFHDVAYSYYYEKPKGNDSQNIIDQHNDKAQVFEELTILVENKIKDNKKLTKSDIEEISKELIKNYPKVFDHNLDQGKFEKVGNFFLYILSFLVYPFSKKTSSSLTKTKSENLFDKLQELTEQDDSEDYLNKKILHTMKNDRLNSNDNQKQKYGNDGTIGYYNVHNKATFINNEFSNSNNSTNNITCMGLLNQKNLSSQDNDTMKFDV